jgi:hypothetical protein
MPMTPEKERELIEAIRDGLIAAWSARRMTKKTYASAGTIERRRWDECARAALSIAAPILRNEALEEGAGAVERLIDTDKIRRECCGNGVQSAYDEPPECCGDPDLMVTIGDAASAIRSLKTKDKPE